MERRSTFFQSPESFAIPQVAMLKFLNDFVTGTCQQGMQFIQLMLLKYMRLTNKILKNKKEIEGVHDK